MCFKYYYIYKIILEKNIKAMYNDNTIIVGSVRKYKRRLVWQIQKIKRKEEYNMPIKMKNLPVTERPYEKLEQYGEKKLTNAELLAIIIKSGTREETSVQLAQKILLLNENQDKNNLNFLREISIEELIKIKGIGKVKAIQIKATCELASRMNSIDNYKNITINKPSDVVDILFDEMRFEKQEILKVVILGNKNKLLKIKDIAKGCGNFVRASIKNVLNEAVKVQAMQIILVHNHPSGDVTPSQNDIEFTREVKKASTILGINLIDHIIIGGNNYISIFSKLGVDNI